MMDGVTLAGHVPVFSVVLSSTRRMGRDGEGQRRERARLSGWTMQFPFPRRRGFCRSDGTFPEIGKQPTGRRGSVAGTRDAGGVCGQGDGAMAGAGVEHAGQGEDGWLVAGRQRQ